MSNDLVSAEETADIAAYVKKHLQPVVDSVVPEFLGVNASKSHAAFGAIVEASALLIAARIIADAIGAAGRETVETLKEIESAVMVTV